MVEDGGEGGRDGEGRRVGEPRDAAVDPGSSAVGADDEEAFDGGDGGDVRRGAVGRVPPLEREMPMVRGRGGDGLVGAGGDREDPHGRGRREGRLVARGRADVAALAEEPEDDREAQERREAEQGVAGVAEAREAGAWEGNG